ncbi:hypothetical protein [Desulfothermus okinawensis]
MKDGGRRMKAIHRHIHTHEYRQKKQIVAYFCQMTIKPWIWEKL